MANRGLSDEDATAAMHMASNLKSKFVTSGQFDDVPMNEANTRVHRWWKQSLEPSGMGPSQVLQALATDILDHICKCCTGLAPRKKKTPDAYARSLSAAVKAVQDRLDSEKPCDFCGDACSTVCQGGNGCKYALPSNPPPRVASNLERSLIFSRCFTCCARRHAHHMCVITASCNVLSGLNDRYCSECANAQFIQRLDALPVKQMQEAALDSSLLIPPNLRDRAKAQFTTRDKFTLAALLRDNCKFVRHSSLVRYYYHFITI